MVLVGKGLRGVEDEPIGETVLTSYGLQQTLIGDAVGSQGRSARNHSYLRRRHAILPDQIVLNPRGRDSDGSRLPDERLEKDVS